MMWAFVKVAVLAVTGTLCCIVMRRGTQEIAVILSLAVCTIALVQCAGMLTPAVETAKKAAQLTNLSPAIYAPVLKCTGIGILAKIAADICRDGGQAAVASAVELAGVCGAMFAALPLVSTLLDCVGGLL